MPVAKGEKKNEYTHEQKAAIVESVCALYESQNVTVESCCMAVGISQQSFNLWCVQFGEFGERYKKAKERQDEHYWEDVIKPLAKKSLQKHLEAEFADEEKDVIYDGVKTGERQFTRKYILPNPTISIFAIKGLFPQKFAERHEHSGPDGAPLFAISPAKQADISDLLDKINGE